MSARLSCALVTALAVLLTGCSTDTVADPPADPIQSGQLVSVTPLPGLTERITSLGGQAARVIYRSTEGDTGAPTIVSGAVFVPPGTAPDGGWPVIAYGHGATGVSEPCAPSLSAVLRGQAEIVAESLRRGYAVALPDYQGLGAPGVHPFGDSRTAGRNLIDAVRALRAAYSGVSGTWAGYGKSQGGGAVWAANEQAPEYAPELDLVGTVSVVPATDKVGAVQKAAAGRLTGEQVHMFQWFLLSLKRLRPDLNLDDYRRGTVAAAWDAMAQCLGEGGSGETPRVDPRDIGPDSPRAAATLRDVLENWALPKQSLSAPLLVAYGGADRVIDAEWTTAALDRACALGGTVVWEFDPGKGHHDFDDTGRLTWLADRFAKQPVTSDC